MRVKMTKKEVAVAKKVMEAILSFAICYCLFNTFTIFG
jgi:hypothetical protein